MPIPLALAGALIAGGTGVAETLGNVFTQSAANRQSRQFQIDMYNRQRSDSINDWNAQNQYNSPAAVMSRYKEAGLNPNLIYGNGTMASAGTPRSSSAGSFTAHAPDVKLGNPVATFFDVRMQQSQLDMMEKQKALMAIEGALKASQIPVNETRIPNIVADTANKQFNLSLNNQLRPTTLAVAEENLRRLSTGTDIAIRQDERAASMSNANLQEIAERILRSKAERGLIPIKGRELEERINLMKKDQQLKEEEIKLRKAGLTPGDPWYFRVGKKLAEKWSREGPPSPNFLKEGIKAGGYAPKKPWEFWR